MESLFLLYFRCRLIQFPLWATMRNLLVFFASS